jgi:multidrug efflux pump subunit AcrA (membrane-fusion protein)
MSTRYKRSTLFVAVLLVAVLGLTGCIGRGQLAQQFQQAGSVAGTDTEYTVTTQDVASGTSVSGTIHPTRSATLMAQAQAKVTAVYVKEGDSIKEGEVLLRIDSRLQDNQVAQAESRYRTSVISAETADLTDLAQTKAQLEAAVQQAQIQELQAENSLKNATVGDTNAATVANLQEQVTKAEENLATAQSKLNYLRNHDTSASTGSDLAVQQAQLDLTTAQNQLVSIMQDPKSLQSAIDAQLARVDTARLSLQNANANAEASKTAADASTAQRILDLNAAQLQVTQAERAVTAAKNDLAGNQKTVDAQANNVEVLKADVDQAKASVAVAKANLAGLSDTEQRNVLQLQSAREQESQALLALNAQKLSSENYVVKAPWSGTVLAVNVSTGEMVSPQTSLMKIADTSVWNVETYVDEVDILNVRDGQDAQITIDSYPDKTFAGKVSYLGRTLVKTPEGLNSYALKIGLTTPPTTVADGMSADATIILSTVKGVLAVPVESVISENGKKYVMLVSSNARNKVVTTKTEIGVGLEGDDYVQVTSGLKAGDHIVRQPVVATQTTPTSGSPFSGG